jgi:hypothetical protein
VRSQSVRKYSSCTVFSAACLLFRFSRSSSCSNFEITMAKVFYIHLIL